MIIFAYDFPHRKTEEFIIFCHLNNIKISAVIGTSWKKLNVSSPKFKTKISIKPIYQPHFLCEKLKIKYHRVDHNSDECFEILKKLKPEIGLIAGARIINSRIIKLFKKGIINFHPGDIPKIRGLNSSLRAIKFNHPQVVTAHLIDEKIDSGIILFKKKLDLSSSDSIFEINEKLYKSQISMITQAIDKTINRQGVKINIKTPYYYKSPYETIEDFQKDFKNYFK